MTDKNTQTTKSSVDFMKNLTAGAARKESLELLGRRMRGYKSIAADALTEVFNRPTNIFQEVARGMAQDPYSTITNERGIDLSNFDGSKLLPATSLRDGFRSVSDYYLYVRVSKQSEEVAMAQIHAGNGSVGYLTQSHVQERCSEVRITGMDKIKAFFLDLLNSKIVYIGGDFVCFDERNIPGTHVDTNRVDYESRTDSLVFGYRMVRVTNGELAKAFSDIVQKYVDDSMTVSGTYTVIKGISETGQLDLLEDTRLDLAKMPLQSFYPAIDQPLEEYWRDFMLSEANLLIIYGPPGTGKSTFTRGMVGTLGLRALATANPAVFLSPSFVTTCGSAMAGKDGKYDVLVAEEAADLLRPRKSQDPEKYKDNPLMNTLLDALDGASRAHTFKMVVTMNAEDLSNIEPALLRTNRTFDAIYMGHITRGEADIVREELGKAPRAFDLKRHRFVLSEVVTDIEYRTSEDAEGNVTVEPRFKPRRLKK